MRYNLLLLMLLFQFSGIAQSPFGKSERRFKTTLHYIELSGGLILPSYNFFETGMDGVSGEMFYMQHTEGFAFRSQFRRHLSFAPRVTYEVRGGHYILEDVSYKIKTHNGSFLIPLEYYGYFSKEKKLTKPGWLLYAGPYVSYSFGGRIEYGDNEILLDNDDLSPFDFGGEVGVGIRVPTFSFTGQGNFTLKASFYHGFISSYPASSNSRIERFNDLMFSESGQRYNMGWKLMLTYEISLSPKEITTFTAGGDGNKTYKRFILKE